MLTEEKLKFIGYDLIILYYSIIWLTFLTHFLFTVCSYHALSITNT